MGPAAGVFSGVKAGFARDSNGPYIGSTACPGPGRRKDLQWDVVALRSTALPKRWR